VTPAAPVAEGAAATAGAAAPVGPDAGRFDPARFRLPPEQEASAPPEARGIRRDAVRLLVARGARGNTGSLEHRPFTDLPGLLAAGDVLVVNTSATLPARVDGETASGAPATVHFAGRLPGGQWMVELRHRVGGSAPGAGGTTAPWLDAAPGTAIHLPGPGRLELRLPASAALVGARPVRLWIATVDLPRPALAYLARHGRPIRYPYVPDPWPIASYQTVFAEVPGSAEMPSAARPFSAEVITRLVARGISIAPFVLHCGVSSPEQHEPPAAEWYRVPAPTADRINAARQAGHRVIGVGTTAVRALETVTDGAGAVHPGEGWTELVVTRERVVRSVDGLLTGWHEPGASHLAMLEAIAGPELVAASYAAALAGGYLWHEFGDSHLLLP
jgi:S-adenosylmethionine:tRNA ribosyltransferase-isomerase